MSRAIITGVPRRSMLLRIVPVELLTARRPQRFLERHWMLNKAGGWTILLTGFFEPLFFLLSVRVGFGALVGDVTDGGRTVEYVDFVAPASLVLGCKREKSGEAVVLIAAAAPTSGSVAEPPRRPWTRRTHSG